MTNQYNTEFEKFKKEGQDYVEQINFDFERKIRGLEERVKKAEAAKRVNLFLFRILYFKIKNLMIFSFPIN